jgi:energy-coupling factor transport system permease protein
LQDPRLILLSTLALSIAAFASVWGALLTLGWWLLATPRRLPLDRWRALTGAFLFVLVTAALVSLSGGNGLSYLLRISVVLLVATWAWGSREGGGFLDVGSWALGNRTGFELGLVAEMVAGSLEGLDRDLSTLLLAVRLKAGRIILRSLLPAVGLLVRRELDRARDRGDILAVRGYRHGGSLCPRFSRGRGDVPAALTAVAIASLALLI